MIKNELWAKIQTSEMFGNLYERWLDEHEYEDINEYAKVLSDNIGVPITQSHKRPFGFTFQCDDGKIKITVRLQGNYMKLKGESIKSTK